MREIQVVGLVAREDRRRQRRRREEHEQARGDADLRVVSEAALASPGLDQVVVSPRSGIRDVTQLAGRTVAVNTPAPNIQTLALDRVLAARGIGPVRYVTMPFAQAGTSQVLRLYTSSPLLDSTRR